MTSDEHLSKIMDQLDGISQDQPSEAFSEEVNEIKEVLEALKTLPDEDSDPQTDREFYSFIDTQKNKNSTSKLLRQWWPYVALAASLVLILYLFLPEKLAEQYAALETNSDKVGFIYHLNAKDISNEEYLWLISLLKSEDNPNIRVTLIDLIEQQKDQLPPFIAQILATEDIPAVQMALLNTIDLNYSPDMKESLLAFNDRDDLDQLVKQRIVDILKEK